jgi:hypothetical protein
MTVPAGITIIEAEIWGSGGAGAGTTMTPGAGGGGGGAGGYVHSLLSVEPGAVLNIFTNFSQETVVATPNPEFEGGEQALAGALNGSDGNAGGPCASPGAGGFGGNFRPNFIIAYHGAAGQKGGNCTSLNTASGTNGAGGALTVGTSNPPPGTGVGGSNGPGGPAYVLLRW